MATPKETTKSIRLTRDDTRIVLALERKFQPTHGRLKFSQIIRIALRKLAELEQVA